MILVYARETIPVGDKSIFLVGPTPRSNDVPSWRPAMVEALQKEGFEGVVFLPENRSGKFEPGFEYSEQASWEHAALEEASAILAWVPRDLDTMPAFTTNVEFGIWCKNPKLIYGRPEGAPKTRYLDYCYQQFLKRTPASTIREAASRAVAWASHPGQEGVAAKVRSVAFKSLTPAQKRLLRLISRDGKVALTDVEGTTLRPLVLRRYVDTEDGEVFLTPRGRSLLVKP